MSTINCEAAKETGSGQPNTKQYSQRESRSSENINKTSKPDLERVKYNLKHLAPKPAKYG